jgi:hypothetical protein
MMVPEAERANPTIAARIIRGNLRVIKIVNSVWDIELTPGERKYEMEFKIRLEDSFAGPRSELTIETITNMVERANVQLATRLKCNINNQLNLN